MTFPVKPCVHFVGFRKDHEYWAAVKVWGKPHYIHMANDFRMREEIHSSDTVVFADGCENKPSERTYADTKEILP